MSLNVPLSRGSVLQVRLCAQNGRCLMLQVAKNQFTDIVHGGIFR